MNIRSALLRNTRPGVLGLTLKRQSLGSVEVDLGVDPCALLGLGALCELLGYCRCFCCWFGINLELNKQNKS